MLRNPRAPSMIIVSGYYRRKYYCRVRATATAAERRPFTGQTSRRVDDLISRAAAAAVGVLRNSTRGPDTTLPTYDTPTRLVRTATTLVCVCVCLLERFSTGNVISSSPPDDARTFIRASTTTLRTRAAVSFRAIIERNKTVRHLPPLVFLPGEQQLRSAHRPVEFWKTPVRNYTVRTIDKDTSVPVTVLRI